LAELDFLLSKVKCMERQINEKGLIGCAACINMPKDESEGHMVRIALSLIHGKISSIKEKI